MGVLDLKELLELFAAFFKIGAFTFGGGYAMISVIEHECVEKRRWITHEDMLHITVIAESTPGPIAINCATFVGARRRGFLGALAATLGVVLPSFLVILAISSFLDSFLEIAWVAGAFRGIKLAVGLLILNAALNMLRNLEKTAFTRTVLVLSAAAMLIGDIMAVRVSTVALMLLAGLLGCAVSRREARS